MRRQGLLARRIKRDDRSTPKDKTAPKFPDPLCRDFTADPQNASRVGDMTENRTAGGKLYLATVIDLCSRRLLGAATGLHPDADLTCGAINMAAATRGGVDAVNEAGWRTDESKRVVLHTDRGSTYTANSFTKLCRQLGIRQSMGRVGSCFDNGAAEAFFSSLEWEVLARHEFENTHQAQAVVLDCCYGFYNHERRHSPAGMMNPVSYENTAAPTGKPHREALHDSGGTTARRQHGVHWISAVPTNLYGPVDNFSPQGSHVLPALIRRYDDAAAQGAEVVTT